MILELAYYGDPILRKRADEVHEVTDEIRQLARDMIETMDYHRGTGLAAPQVKRSIRLFVARLSNIEDYEDWIRQPVDIFINPEICEYSEQMVEDHEGCLSIPGVNAKVLRPKSVRIRAMDLDGVVVDRVYEDYLARTILHENDHLNGVLYIDRLPKAQRMSLLNYLQQKRKRQRR